MVSVPDLPQDLPQTAPVAVPQTPAPVANLDAPEFATDNPPVAQAESPTGGEPMANSENVLPFTKPVKSKGKRPTGGTRKRAVKAALSGTKTDAPPAVEAGKQSKGTWAFRLRWNRLPGRPIHYVSRVSDAVYELIRKDADTYENFKAQLIRNYEQRAIRASK